MHVFDSVLTYTIIIVCGCMCIIIITDTTVTIIGFENISVSVQEHGVVVLYVAVLDGTLDRDVSVQFSTADISATGEPYCHASATIL